MNRYPNKGTKRSAYDLWFRRTGPREPSDELADAGNPAVGAGDGEQASALDEFARRIISIAHEAGQDYIARSQAQARAIVAGAQEQAALELAQAKRAAAIIETAEVSACPVPPAGTDGAGPSDVSLFLDLPRSGDLQSLAALDAMIKGTLARLPCVASARLIDLDERSARVGLLVSDLSAFALGLLRLAVPQTIPQHEPELIRLHARE